MLNRVRLHGIESVGRIRKTPRRKLCLELPQKRIDGRFTGEVDRNAAVVVW